MQRRSGRTSRLPLNPVAFATILVLILFQPFMYALSYRQMDAWQTRLLQAKASILLINQLPDTRLTKILYPNLQFLVEKANALDQLKLLRPSLVKTKHLNELRGPGALGLGLGSAVAGYFGDLSRLDKTAEGFSASGSCTLSEKRVPDAVILAYDTGNQDPIAFAMTHPVKRPASITQGVAKTGAWTIRLAPEQLPQSPVTITAWAFDATTGQAFPLSGIQQINTAP
jgi:hypothetical protein